MAGKLPQVTDEEWLTFNPKNRKIAEEFLKQQTHLSPQTLKQYKSGLRHFVKWLHDEVDDKEIFKLKPIHALKYQNYLTEAGLSSAAVRFKRAAVSSLCGYIEVYYSDEYPEFRNIYNKMIPNPPKAPVHIKEPLTPEELKTLVDELRRRGEWQMVAYIMFSYSSGCRRAEARQLLKEVVTYDKVKDKKTGDEKPYYMTHMIRCKGRGVTGKQRRLMFDDVAVDAIKKWLEVRGEDECEYVFVSKNKNGETHQLSEATFNYWCKNVFTPIVGKRVHPHALRSSRATNLSEYEGKDIKSIQALLGHESSETTSIYIVRDIDDDVDEIF